MDEYNKEIRRKIAARKLAMKYMPDFQENYEYHTSTSLHIKKIHEQHEEMNPVLFELNTRYKLFTHPGTYYPNLPRIVRGIRKCLRKTTNFFGSILYYPLIREQNIVNKSATQLFNQVNSIVVNMVDVLDTLSEEINNIHTYSEEISMENLAIINECRKISVIEKDNESLKAQMKYLMDKMNVSCDISVIEKDNESLKAQMKYLMDKMNVSCDISLLENSNIDYFAFENKFRGPRETVKSSQSEYIDFFRCNSGSPVLDIGCGRGEFLELMYDYGITAQGIDCYPPFVNYCKERGFSVKQADALTYLSGLEAVSLGGIFMAHVAEHLSNDYLIALIRTAYIKLKPGCYFILETPNPECLAAMTEFYIDISHEKPLHYQTLKELFLSANYSEVSQYVSKSTKWPVQLQKIEADESSYILSDEVYNLNTEHLNSLLFGYRDYTLIAHK